MLIKTLKILVALKQVKIKKEKRINQEQKRKA